MMMVWQITFTSQSTHCVFSLMHEMAHFYEFFHWPLKAFVIFAHDFLNQNLLKGVSPQ